MPAGRAQWLRGFAEIVDEARATHSPAAKAQADAEHQQRLAENERKLGRA